MELMKEEKEQDSWREILGTLGVDSIKLELLFMGMKTRLLYPC